MGGSRLGSRDGTGTGLSSHESRASPFSDQLDGVAQPPGLSERSFLGLYKGYGLAHLTGDVRNRVLWAGSAW